MSARPSLLVRARSFARVRSGAATLGSGSRARLVALAPKRYSDVAAVLLLVLAGLLVPFAVRYVGDDSPAERAVARIQESAVGDVDALLDQPVTGVLPAAVLVELDAIVAASLPAGTAARVTIWDRGYTAIYSSDRHLVGTAMSAVEGYSPAGSFPLGASQTLLTVDDVSPLSPTGTSTFSQYFSRQETVVLGLVLGFLASYVMLVSIARRHAGAAHRAHSALGRSRERFRSMVMNTSDVIALIDVSGSIQYISPSVQRAWGYEPESLLYQSIVPLVRARDARAVRDALEAAVVRPGEPQVVEFDVRRRALGYSRIEAAVTNLIHDPNVNGIVLNCRDVTERTRLQHRLAQLAYFDELTDLPNRTYFFEQVGQQLDELRDAPDEANKIALMLIDLDNFKLVNDTRGHLAGDQLLAAFGRHLRAVVEDDGELARLGGDEFAIAMAPVRSHTTAAEIAERIIGRLRSPILVDGNPLYVSASIGITVGEADASVEDLLSQADVALYRCKESGGASFIISDEEADSSWVERIELEADLHRALERDELELLFQPVVDLSDGSLMKMEALLRWHHATRGTISPAKFIPIAEQSGEIVRIGRWVLDTACRQAAHWNTVAPMGQAVGVIVNVSSIEFRQPDFVLAVARALRESELAAEQLTVEITESVLIEDVEHVVERVREIKQLGARVSIDDFGTGFSSLRYLRELPADLVKLDQSFVTDLPTSERTRSIVRSVVHLAASLGMEAIAEGVETLEQRAALLELGFTRAQGYLFARPLNGSKATHLASRVDGETVGGDEVAKAS